MHRVPVLFPFGAPLAPQRMLMSRTVQALERGEHALLEVVSSSSSARHPSSPSSSSIVGFFIPLRHRRHRRHPSPGDVTRPRLRWWNGKHDV
jgi:hypothetical protein